MQRYFSTSLTNGYFKLDPNDYYHIRKVMRMQDGDQIEVVYDGQAYLACLESVKNDCKVKKIKPLMEGVQKIPEVIIVLPFLKEKKMDFIIQKATELGVSELLVMNMEHSIIKLNKEKLNQKLERWQRISKEASEQSKRITIPKISFLDTISRLEKVNGLKLICSTRSDKNNLSNLLQMHKTYDKIVIVIGPEGGLTNLEEEQFIKIGFSPVRLGNNIMRVETVPIFFLSVINYEYME